jgi:hypothetical protein
MPATVDDFMRRFGGSQTIDDRDAAAYHDRFVSTNSEDQDFDNQTYQQSATEYLGKLPDDDFQQGARTAFSQAPPQERQSMLGGLLGALGGTQAGGGKLGKLAEMLGLKTTDPNQMDEDEAARVMNYARRERPEALEKVVQEKPWFVKAMGNPVVQGALAVAAAKMLQRQQRGR